MVASEVTTLLGQAAIGVLVAVIGYLLNRKVKEVHVLVNAQMNAALTRIAELEKKLGLTSGEAIPTAAVVTAITPNNIHGADVTPTPEPPT